VECCEWELGHSPSQNQLQIILDLKYDIWWPQLPLFNIFFISRMTLVNINSITKISQYKYQFLIGFVTTMLLKNNIMNTTQICRYTVPYIAVHEHTLDMKTSVKEQIHTNIDSSSLVCLSCVSDVKDDHQYVNDNVSF